MVKIWSIGTKSQTNFKSGKNTLPGPGEYSPYVYHNQTPPQWKFGSDKHRENQFKGKVNPGPGQYKPGQTTYKQFPQYQFGVKSLKVEQAWTPGPGQYSPDYFQTLKSNPSYKFGMKYSESQTQLTSSQVPPPNLYIIDRDKCLVKRPSSKIGNAQRQPLCYISSAPGPGAYEVPKESLQQTYPQSIGHAQRINSTQNFRENPGPGAYYNQKLYNTLTNISKTMGVKYCSDANLLKQQANSPGPQSYQPLVNYTKLSSTGIKFGKEIRCKLESELVNIPAPNNYNPSFINKKRPSSYKIGTESRHKILSKDTPGVGSYQLLTEFGEGPKYKFGQKYKSNEADDFPGPFEYETVHYLDNIKKRPASHRIGTANRNKESATSTPGVGTYQFKHEYVGQGHRFGHALRDDIYRPSTNPGPGQYKVPTKFNDFMAYQYNYIKKSQQI